MSQKPIVIIGAGMAGCFLAIALAKKGHSIVILEKRDSLESVLKESGRSFNLTLYYRGIQALKKLSLWEKVKQHAEIAEGNVAHFAGGIERFDYFDNENEVLYTIHRNSLNKTLIELAAGTPNVSIKFHTSLIAVDRNKTEVLFEDTRTGSTKRLTASFIVGADGANSVVRASILSQQESLLSQEYSDWGYKEVWISPQKAQLLSLRMKATHTWPRKESLLLAFPNPDESLTLMFNLPRNGEHSFASLQNENDVKRYITRFFPELLTLLPEITESLLHKPLGHFVTIKTSPWYHKDNLVLVGDAAHAVLPFYGQGMCAAFEDCLTLTELLSKYKDREKAFQRYQEIRKPNTDVLAQLSVDNFIELRDKSRSDAFIIKDQLYTFLHRLFPKNVLPPLYVLIAHGTLPYKEALAQFNAQEKKARLLGVNLLISVVVPVLKSVRFLKSSLAPQV